MARKKTGTNRRRTDTDRQRISARVVGVKLWERILAEHQLTALAISNCSSRPVS